MIRAPRLVVIPMKDPARAKSRLAGSLPPESRAALAERLFLMTVQQLARIRGAAHHGFDIATVTASPRIAAHARAAGIAVIEQGPLPGLNAAARDAALWAHGAGYAALALLPGDLARPDPADLLTLLDRPADPGQAVICAASDGGTNALLLPLPARMEFRYGPGSFRAHLAAAGHAGLRALTPHLESLRHDVDRAEDLTHLAMPARPCAEVRP